jgi:hypothetical protein
MQIFKAIVSAVIIAALFVGASLATEDDECIRDIAIPCIQTFHDAIAPSCHKYMPAKDYETARKHVPNMVAQAASIADLRLDSTYADVADDFYEKRRVFLSAVDKLMAATEGEDDNAFAKAFDRMHDAFAAMVSSLVSAPEELDRFHALVAEVWHKMLPAKDYEGIKKTIPKLEEASRRLAAANLGESHKDIKDKYLAAVGELESSIGELAAAVDTKSDEAIQKAAADFHEKFEKVMMMF